MSCIETTIAEIGKKYEQKYGFVVLAVEFKETQDKVVLKGKVLTEKQRNEIADAVAATCGKKVKNEIKAISAVRSSEAGWAVVKNEIADLRSRFVPSAVMNEKIQNRLRATQAKKGEVLRILLHKDDQLLVQSGDLALGWISRNEVTLKKTSLRKEWGRGIFAEPNKLITVKGEGKKIVEEAEKFLGVKYVLGAKSLFGIDCSGLTQYAYKNAFDIILPRHSWDQKKTGRQVGLEKAKTGDIVFVINKETDTKHVGIWKECAAGPCIVHASFTKGEVVCQNADEVFSKYDLAEIRRIIKK